MKKLDETVQEMIQEHKQNWSEACRTASHEAYAQYHLSGQEMLDVVTQNIAPRYAASGEVPLKERDGNVMRLGTRRTLRLRGDIGGYTFIVTAKTATLTDIGWPHPWTSCEEQIQLRAYVRTSGHLAGDVVAEYTTDGYHSRKYPVHNAISAIERRIQNEPGIERVSTTQLYEGQR